MQLNTTLKKVKESTHNNKATIVSLIITYKLAASKDGVGAKMELITVLACENRASMHSYFHNRLGKIPLLKS